MTKNKNLEKTIYERNSNGISTDEKRKQIRESRTGITAILGVLSDAVATAIMRCIAETGECSRKDLETLDAVVEEGESLIRGLRESGLIEVGEDTVALTEKGRKALAFIDELEDHVIRR
jgi:predicted transcriptional regulator